VSKGEKRISKYLDDKNIEYIYNQAYFSDLRGTNGGLLKPDFIIPSLKIWIEYDGQQHFEPINFSGDKCIADQRFITDKTNDETKDKYAKDNNWTLIRIPYWEFDNIENILNNYM
jgi:very-short-patch-repair endonuclease